MKTRDATPWGPADFVRQVAPGIWSCSTPSHGGFYLEPWRPAQMAEPYRSHPTFTGLPQWFEEDCDWAVVALAFPEFFTPLELEQAKRSWQWMLERQAQNAATVTHPACRRLTIPESAMFEEPVEIRHSPR